MPWVNQELCTGCGTCVEQCPAEAVSLVDEKATINDEECIRCGTCHDVCPEEAVRHDSERIPEQIDANLAWTRRLLQHFETSEEKRGLIERMKKYFNKEKKVAEATLQQLESLKEKV